MEALLTDKPRTMLHITDGESVAGTLRQSAVPGEVRIFGDLMYEGPAPAGLTDAEWWDTRARFHSECFDLTLAETGQAVRAFEESLNIIPRHDETVLWMDHRLSDQLILIMLLQRFYRLYCEKSSLSLICLGQYPGMENFVGLGQLTAEQLASLADTRSPVSETQFALASAAWNAFTSSVPTDIELFLARDTSALPFLAPALRRHLEQLPSVENGLSRTEQQALSVLRDRVRYLLCNSSSLFKKQSTLSSWETVLLRDSQRIGIGKVPSRSPGEQCRTGYVN